MWPVLFSFRSRYGSAILINYYYGILKEMQYQKKKKKKKKKKFWRELK